MSKDKARRLAEAAKFNVEHNDVRTGIGMFAPAVAEVNETQGEHEMTQIPDGLPTLSAGAHSPGEGKACAMEYVSILAGERFSDSPSCTDPVLAAATRSTNDWMTDEGRHMLVPLIGRLFGTAERGSKETAIALAEYAYAYVHKAIEAGNDEASDLALFNYLKGLIDEFDRVTGFNYEEEGRKLTSEEYKYLTEAVAR